jgi:hypothetical protein
MSMPERYDGAANSSPPPCGEGLGVGVVQCGTSVPDGTPPTPTLPHKGEGVRLGAAASQLGARYTLQSS